MQGRTYPGGSQMGQRRRRIELGWLRSILLPNRKAPRGGRLSTGCGDILLTPGIADRVSVHACPVLGLTRKEWR